MPFGTSKLPEISSLRLPLAFSDPVLQWTRLEINRVQHGKNANAVKQ